MKIYLLFNNKYIDNSLKRYFQYIRNVNREGIETSLDYKITNGYIHIELDDDALLVCSFKNNSYLFIIDKINALFNYQNRKNKKLFLFIFDLDTISEEIFNKFSTSLYNLKENIEEPELFTKTDQNQFNKILKLFREHV